MKKFIRTFLSILFLINICACSMGDSEKQEKEMYIATYPQTSFAYKDHFTSEGLRVLDKETSREITNYTTSIQEGTELKTVGEVDVFIKATSYKTISYVITVVAEKALSISHEPNKTTYLEGEVFDASGLVVTDENNQEITDYILSIPDGTTLNNVGEIEIVVSKDDYLVASFKINVNENTDIEEKSRDLRIFYINDTHGSFIRQETSSGDEAGMSYIGAYIKSEVMKDKENSIVISGGDMFQGGLESNETKGAIMIDAMNEIGFDAMVLGNHEFDWGESYIPQFVESLDCDLISSNVFYANTSNRPEYLKPYTIIERGDLKIGVIGADQEDMGSSITGSVSSLFDFPAPNSYIKEFSDELRLNYQCDIVIAAFHDGGYEGRNGQPAQYYDLTEISPVTGQKYADAMLFAHDHNYKYGKYNGVPYMEAGCNGRYIGEMTLSLKGKTSYDVESSSINVFNAYDATEGLTPDPVIEALPEKYRDIIGDPDEVLYKFSRYYSKNSFANIVCQAMLWYTNERLDTHVYMATHNYGGVRANVESGVFTRRDLIKVFPFDNDICIQTCTRSNVDYQMNNSSWTYYYDEDIVYDSNGHTKVVTISYIAENELADTYAQVSYVRYNITAKNVLEIYLREKINPSL